MGVLATSTAAIVIRFAQEAAVPSLVIAAYRLAFSTLILSAMGLRQQGWREYVKLTTIEAVMLLLSGLFLGMHFASWVTSLEYTSVLSSVVLVSTTPLWIGLAAPFLLGERNPLWTWIGILVAMVGGVVIALADVVPTGVAATWGDILALTGAIMGAGYMLIGRRLRQRLSLFAYIWLVYGVAAVVLVAWAVLARLPLTGYGLDAIVWMALLALVPQLIGHSSLNYALGHLSATFVAVAALGEPIGSTLLAILLLGEVPSGDQLLGSGLILFGIALASRGEHRIAKSKVENNVEDTLL